MWIGTVARGGVELLAFAPDGRHLYTRAAADITAWDLAARTPTKLGLAEYFATNGGLAPSPDGRHLVVTHAAERLDVYDLTERRWASQQKLNLWSVWQPTFVNGGDILLTVEQTHNAEHVLAARRWPSLDLIPLTLPRPTEIAAVRWADIAADPTSNRLVATVRFDDANHLAVFGPGFPDTAVVRTISGAAANGWRLVVSPGGASAAVARNSRVAAIDLDTGATRFDVRVSKTDVNRLAYHPAGRLLAAAANDGKVYFLDAATGQTLRAFDWPIGKVRSVAFSPDGCVCAAGGVKALAVWDVDE